MLLWKNYGGAKPAAIQTSPWQGCACQGLRQDRCAGLPTFPPPGFSHKTLRGHVLRRVLAYPEKFNRRPGCGLVCGLGLHQPRGRVGRRLADAAHEPVLYHIKKQNRVKATASSREGGPDPLAATLKSSKTSPEQNRQLATTVWLTYHRGAGHRLWINQKTWCGLQNTKKPISPCGKVEPMVIPRLFVTRNVNINIQLTESLFDLIFYFLLRNTAIFCYQRYFKVVELALEQIHYTHNTWHFTFR